LDLTIGLTGTGAETQVSITNNRQLNYYSGFQPMYIDFQFDFIAVKGQTVDQGGDPEREAMLFYRREAGTTTNLFWGLNPSEYYNEYTQGDITTPCIPVVLVKTVDNNPVTFVRFTQTQNVAPAPTSSSSEEPEPTSSSVEPEPTSSSVEPTPSEVVTETAPLMKLFGLRTTQTVRANSTRVRTRRNGTPGGFSAFQAVQPVITIDQEEIFETDANQISLVFNEGLGATEQSSIGFTKFFQSVDPDPTPTSSSSSVEPTPTSSTSSGSESSGTSGGMEWWVWVIIGLIIFLIIVGVLLYFITKNKEEEEENDDYMSPEENKQFADEED
jgi:hypothetical protein